MISETIHNLCLLKMYASSFVLISFRMLHNDMVIIIML